MPKQHTKTGCQPALDKDELLRVVDVLGPEPRKTLVAFFDYGLDDDEIGRYFKIKSRTIKSLRRYLLQTGGHQRDGQKPNTNSTCND